MTSAVCKTHDNGTQLYTAQGIDFHIAAGVDAFDQGPGQTMFWRGMKLAGRISSHATKAFVAFEFYGETPLLYVKTSNESGTIDYLHFSMQDGSLIMSFPPPNPAPTSSDGKVYYPDSMSTDVWTLYYSIMSAYKRIQAAGVGPLIVFSIPSFYGDIDALRKIYTDATAVRIMTRNVYGVGHDYYVIFAGIKV